MSEIELLKIEIASVKTDISDAKKKLKDAEERQDREFIKLYLDNLTSLNNQLTAKENLLLAAQQQAAGVS
jgi:flagellar capping protein FliD